MIPAEWSPGFPEIITAHAHGWAVCKADGIEQMPLGWRLSLDRGADRERWIVTGGAADEIVDLLEAAPPGTAVRMCADPTWWESRLPRGWVLDHEGWYFTAPLEEQAQASAEVEVSTEGSWIGAVLRHHGEVVARGQAGAWGRWLTLDSIEVDPEHRRRGHGRRIVASLCHAGLDAGCTTGVLSSTRLGRHLYSSMGWAEIGPQVCGTKTARQDRR